jgi:hypothetical protein
MKQKAADELVWLQPHEANDRFPPDFVEKLKR